MNSLDDGDWEAQIYWETALGEVRRAAQYGSSPKEAVELLIATVLADDEIEDRCTPQWIM